MLRTMDMSIAFNNLTSVAVLVFVLGFIGAIFKSDLRIPDSIYQLISIYLLLGIGLKGGHALKDVSFQEIIKPSLATLIYTSGTTGKPKGVQLSHANFLSECGNVVQGASELFLKPGGSTLLFLPVAHVFGRMVQIGSISAGLHMAHCSDPVGRLPMDLASFKPTLSSSGI